MKTRNELKAIIQKWYVYNSKQSQVAEGKYLLEQIYDYESNFTQFQKEGYVTPEVDFELVRSKDVKDGISFKLVSGDVYIDGILNTLNGVITLKEIEGNNLGSTVFVGARMNPES